MKFKANTTRDDIQRREKIATTESQKKKLHKRIDKKENAINEGSYHTNPLCYGAEINVIIGEKTYLGEINTTKDGNNVLEMLKTQGDL
jgi:hypothetical protein